jgi:hypothetical protein
VHNIKNKLGNQVFERLVKEYEGILEFTAPAVLTPELLVLFSIHILHIQHRQTNHKEIGRISF